MRLQFVFAVGFICSLLLAPLAAWAGQRGDRPVRLQAVSTSSHESLHPTPQTVQPDLLARYTPKVPSQGPNRLKDLLFKSQATDSKSGQSTKLGVEPWAPGKGALGIRVEVTW